MLSCFVFIFRPSTAQYVENVMGDLPDISQHPFGVQSSSLTSLIMDIAWKVYGHTSPLSTSFINHSIEIDFRQAGENFQPLFGKSLGPDFGWGPAVES